MDWVVQYASITLEVNVILAEADAEALAVRNQASQVIRRVSDRPSGYVIGLLLDFDQGPNSGKSKTGELQ